MLDCIAQARTASNLYRFMVKNARLRDRLYFCSDVTAAAQLNVSRRTIIRCRQQLESEGRIQRRGWHHWTPTCKTVVYGFPEGQTRVDVTQRTTCRKPSTRPTRNTHYVRVSEKGSYCKKRAGEPLDTRTPPGDAGEDQNRPQPRRRNELWDVIEELFGPCRTRQEATKRGMVVRELAQAAPPATPDEVRVTYRFCAKHYSRFTEMALLTNLSAATQEAAKGSATIDHWREMKANLQARRMGR